MDDVVEAVDAALDHNSNICCWLHGMIPSTLESIPDPLMQLSCTTSVTHLVKLAVVRPSDVANPS
eukprot:2226923-Pyramimonas_sp.AAC.1